MYGLHLLFEFIPDGFLINECLLNLLYIFELNSLSYQNLPFTVYQEIYFPMIDYLNVCISIITQNFLLFSEIMLQFD